MTHKKSFLLACSLALLISLNNCVFLKSTDKDIGIATTNFDCPTVVKKTIVAVRPNLQASVKQTQKEGTEETVAPGAEMTQGPAEEEDLGEGQPTEAPMENGTEAPAAPAAPAAECPKETDDKSNYNDQLRGLQAELEKQITDLNLKQETEREKVDQMASEGSKELIDAVNQQEKALVTTGVAPAVCPAPVAEAPAEKKETPMETPQPPVLTKLTAAPLAKEGVAEAQKGCEVNLIQVDGVDGVDAIGDFAKVLDLKVGAPTVSNSISSTTSIAKGVADNESVANTTQNVKSTTTAEAEGQNNAIAVSNVVGNTEAKTENLAVDNSRAVTVVDDQNTGTAKANADENALATANVKNDQTSETNTVALNNSTAIGGSQMTSNTESTANAEQGSIADSKAISDEKSVTNTGAVANSTAIGASAVNTDTASLADASNQSLAQSVAQSENKAQTTTVALNDSAAVGATRVDSDSNSTALAKDGGNALSISDAKSTVATESIAKDNSASVVQNNGGSQSNATSVSTGIAGPYENPLQPAQNASSDNATGITLQQPAGTEATAPAADCGVKIPSILDTASKVTLKSNEGTNITDKIMAEKESCGTLEEHKADVLQSGGYKAAKETEDRQAQRAKEQEERDRLKAEERKLREDTKRLKQEREDREDRERAARKAAEKRKRKSRKYRKSKKRADRDTESDAYDMSAPRLQSGDDSELNRKVTKDFEDSLREQCRPDARFEERNMFADNIKEYDERRNDERVNDDCTDICKKENLGSFLSSEIQDVLRGNFLFKCHCKEGISEWYMYDSKTDKSRPLSSTSRHLLDEREPSNFCDDIPFPRREAREGTNASAAPALKAIAAPEGKAPVLTAPSDYTDEGEDETDGDREEDSRCGNFVSARIDAAKRRAKGGSDDRMYSDLGECFNNFISNKFDKLHRRLNKIKSKHTNYVKDLHKKQLRKQAAKVEGIVDKSAGSVNGPELSGASECEPLRGGDNLRNIQASMNDLKQSLKQNDSKKQTPEDSYFQARNEQDQKRFNQRLADRFDDRVKCENDRFSNRFADKARYGARDEDPMAGAKKAASLKADSGSFISSHVGRIKEQNREYLGKIKNMFGGCE